MMSVSKWDSCCSKAHSHSRPIDPTMFAALISSSSKMGSTTGSRGVVSVPQHRRLPTQSDSRLELCISPDATTAPTRDTMEMIARRILEILNTRWIDENSNNYELKLTVVFHLPFYKFLVHPFIKNGTNNVELSKSSYL